MFSWRYTNSKGNVIICCLFAVLLFTCTSITPGNNNNILVTPNNTPNSVDNGSDSQDNIPGTEAISSPIMGNTPQIKNDLPNIADGGFLSGEPCGPPCFWNIIPGVTTKAEAVQILQLKGVFQKCETFSNVGGRGIICRSIMTVNFRPDMDIVDSVGFSPSRKITVKEVIAKYGEPDAVSVTPNSIPEDPRVVMNLYYDNIQTTLGLPEQEGITFRVEPSTEITNIGYFDPTTRKKSPEFSLPKWTGYGEYQLDETW